MINLNDLCYSFFGPISRSLLKVYRRLEDDLDAANLRFHPEVYLSIVIFFALVTASFPLLTFLIFVFSSRMGLSTVLSNPLYLLAYLIWTDPRLCVVAAASPLIVLLLGISIPSLKASNRISGLKTEIPYASVYLSVMASGGLNPYTSLLRLKETDLLPRLREEIERIQGIVLSSGCDPVSAMEKAAKVIGLKEYKDLLLGYASTLRTGGDVLHYLYTQTHSMFRNMATRVKAMGEKMGALMEAYTIVGILGTLGLYMMFVIAFSIPESGLNISKEFFFAFAFLILPLISGFFIYLCDALQISYPSSSWRIYLIFLGTLPVTLFLVSQTVIPFYDPSFLLVPALKELTVFLTSKLNLGRGCEPALGLAFSLTVTTVPIVFINSHYTKEEKGILQGITTFLRDLVENRKTGLSPERCIQILSRKDYGKFSKHLRSISSQIGWGVPLKKIFEDFKENVGNWLAQINMYILIDSIEVGGGTKESLETLAEFSESMMEIERERRSVLAPLFIVPYIGAILLTTTTVLFLQFFNDMAALGGSSILIVTLREILLMPLIFHSYMLGLVAGKIASGKLSSGFKQAVILTMFSMLGIWIAFNFQGPMSFGAGGTAP